MYKRNINPSSKLIIIIIQIFMINQRIFFVKFQFQKKTDLPKLNLMQTFILLWIFFIVKNKSIDKIHYFEYYEEYKENWLKTGKSYLCRQSMSMAIANVVSCNCRIIMTLFTRVFGTYREEARSMAWSSIMKWLDARSTRRVCGTVLCPSKMHIIIRHVST